MDKKFHTSLVDKYAMLQNDAKLLSNEIEKQRDENGRLIAKVSSFTTESKELEDKLRDERLKKLRSKVEFQTITEYDTILMNIHDTIVVKNGDTITQRTFEHKTKWISLKGEIHNHIVNINELVIHDSLDVQFGEEKDGWFKRKNVVLVKSSNPNSDLQDIRPYEFKEKKKWYERGGWKFLSGGILTLLLISQL